MKQAPGVTLPLSLKAEAEKSIRGQTYKVFFTIIYNPKIIFTTLSLLAP
jgi:hypothetical protein